MFVQKNKYITFDNLTFTEKTALQYVTDDIDMSPWEVDWSGDTLVVKAKDHLHDALMILTAHVKVAQCAFEEDGYVALSEGLKHFFGKLVEADELVKLQ